MVEKAGGQVVDARAVKLEKISRPFKGGIATRLGQNFQKGRAKYGSCIYDLRFQYSHCRRFVKRPSLTSFSIRPFYITLLGLILLTKLLILD